MFAVMGTCLPSSGVCRSSKSLFRCDLRSPVSIGLVGWLAGVHGVGMMLDKPQKMHHNVIGQELCG